MELFESIEDSSHDLLANEVRPLQTKYRPLRRKEYRKELEGFPEGVRRSIGRSTLRTAD